MNELPSNIQEIFNFLNLCLIAAQMAALYIGLRKFSRVLMVGDWFRWKTAGYTAIMLADLVALYFMFKGNPLYVAIRLTVARVVVLWETCYCFHWKYARASDSDRFILSHLMDAPHERANKLPERPQQY